LPSLTAAYALGAARVPGRPDERITLGESQDWYRTPAETTTRYREFVETARGEGAEWAHIIGEPIWPGRSRAENAAWVRYESLLNLTFAPWPVTVTCLYDSRTAPRRVVIETGRTHPVVGTCDGTTESRDYLPPEQFLTA
jgi:DcmR-like sensory protein